MDSNLKFEKMLVNAFFSSRFTNIRSLIRAWSWFAADLQIFVICRLKFSLSSICTSRSLTDDEIFIFFWSILMYSAVWFYFFLSMIMLWNFPRFTIILLDWNHEIAVLLSDSRTNFKFLISDSNARRELSSPKLCTLALSMKWKKYLKKQLNNLWMTMDPLGTPEMTFWKLFCAHYLRERTAFYLKDTYT